MINNLIAFLMIIVCGVFFQWKKPAGVDPDKARHAINTIVIKFFMPALCFKVIATMEINSDVIFFPLSAILTVLSAMLFSYLTYTVLGKFIKVSKKEKGAAILTSSFGNVTFFGIPILTALYGSEAIKFPILYDCMGTAILLWTIGIIISAYYGGGRKVSLKDGIKSFAMTPPIWGMALGYIVNFAGFGHQMPEFFIAFLDLMSAPIIGIMVFSIGMMLKIPQMKSVFTATPAVIIKLCISPLIAFLFAVLLGLDGLAFKATIVDAAMPVMVLSLAIVSEYKLDESIAALIAVITVILSFITIPITALLVG